MLLNISYLVRSLDPNVDLPRFLITPSYELCNTLLIPGVREASDIYGKRMHNLCCDNCHSHVATALGMNNCPEYIFLLVCILKQVT